MGYLMGFRHQQLQTGMVTIDSMEIHGIYWVYFGGCTANHNCLGLPKNGGRSPFGTKGLRVPSLTMALLAFEKPPFFPAHSNSQSLTHQQKFD
jgi:hypothetical protein